MHGLIDGDIITYSCAFAAEGRDYQVVPVGQKEAIFSRRYKADINQLLEKEGLEEGVDVEVVKVAVPLGPGIAMNNVRNMLDSIKTGAGCTSSQVYLTGKGNFREDVATIKPYKAKRPPKPYYYQLVRDYLEEAHDAEVIHGMEADDALAIAQNSDTIICTIDKDLDMVPGWHYNWQKACVYCVDEEEAEMNFLLQLVTGDNTDNIPGLYHITGHKVNQEVRDDIRERGKVAVLFWYKDHLQELEEIGKLLWMKRTLDDNWTLERLND